MWITARLRATKRLSRSHHGVMNREWTVGKVIASSICAARWGGLWRHYMSMLLYRRGQYLTSSPVGVSSRRGHIMTLQAFMTALPQEASRYSLDFQWHLLRCSRCIGSHMVYVTKNRKVERDAMWTEVNAFGMFVLKKRVRPIFSNVRIRNVLLDESYIWWILIIRCHSLIYVYM